MAPLTITKDIADAICDAALSVDGVAGLSSGRMAHAVLRLPGALIEGLQVFEMDEEGTHIAVHLIYDLSSDREIPQLVRDVRAAILAVPALAQAPGLPRVDVVVEDAVRHSTTK